MSKRTCTHISKYVSALCVDEQAVDIMPEPNSGGLVINGNQPLLRRKFIGLRRTYGKERNGIR
jgi:hypothetical protein